MDTAVYNSVPTGATPNTPAVTTTTTTKNSSGKGATMWIAIIALVLSIVAFIAIIVYFIAYAVSGGTPGPRASGCRYNIVTGVSDATSTTDKFNAVGCACYYSSFGNTSGITLTVTGPSKPQGQSFMIDNSDGAGPITITTASTISIYGSDTINTGEITTWYWSSNTVISRISTQSSPAV